MDQSLEVKTARVWPKPPNCHLEDNAEEQGVAYIECDCIIIYTYSYLGILNTPLGDGSDCNNMDYAETN